MSEHEKDRLASELQFASQEQLSTLESMRGGAGGTLGNAVDLEVTRRNEGGQQS